MQPTTGNLVADTICRTAEIGLTITGAADAGNITVIDATPVAVSNACPECSRPGKLRDHVLRRLVDLPVVGFPTRLHVRVPRFTCTNAFCGRKIFQATLSCADDGAKLTHRVTRWILQRLAIDRMSVSATAKALGIGWELVNQVALEACRKLVYDNPSHLDGVRILGVDEHVWKHTRKPGQPSGLVTILVDLTPLVDGRGPARLLDIRPGRSAQVLRGWLQERDPGFRKQVQVVTMDGFAGYATAVDEVLPQATKVMDPFHVVHLAADKLTRCRQRLQRETQGRRGRKDDPLYKHRRTLLTRRNYLTERQKQRLEMLWATDDDYVALEVTWLFYQDMIAAYGHPKKSEGKKLMSRVINSIRKGLPEGLTELAQLGRTLWRRREDILAYFDVGAPNGPVEVINGRLEHLRGIALGFRNLDHYILRSLIHSGQLQARINAL
ncbi:ISL3 family transposase [Corynebacterium suedekumii]|uniref:ISL3 family transposase n=1 Tax=Corynebacterium suedekumii TaxID=3049801 RepID=A0ABY8VQF6_9CORY|nr:ISL3 family transposase [Corynebacterium suedekumii]WIM71207.1 ISL3 family transposase [Corynebacterium suedekumii]